MICTINRVNLEYKNSEIWVRWIEFLTSFLFCARVIGYILPEEVLLFLDSILLSCIVHCLGCRRIIALFISIRFRRTMSHFI